MDLALYVFGGIALLVVIWLFVFRLYHGLLVFYLAGLSIQYLEKVVFGSFSALDFVGIGAPLLFLIGLFWDRKRLGAKLPNDPITKVFVGILFTMFFSGLLFGGLIYPSRSHLTFLQKLGVWAKFFNGFVIVMAVSAIFTDETKVRRLINCILISLLIPSLIAVWEIASGRTMPHGNSAYSMPWAYFHHPGVLAFAAVSLFPLLLLKAAIATGVKRRLASWCLPSAMLVLIYFTYRRTAWLGLLAQLATWFVLLRSGKSKILYSYLLVSCVVIITIIGADVVTAFGDRLSDLYSLMSNVPDVFYNKKYDNLLTGRWGIFRTNLQFLLNQSFISLLVGNGIGSTFYAALSEGGRGGYHSCYFILLIEFGVINFFGYIALMGLLAARVIRGLRSESAFVRDYSRMFASSLVGYMVMGVGTHLFYEITSGVWFFWALAGLLMGLVSAEKKATAEE
jgi:hypothetical protein